MSRKLTKEEFILKARKVHGDKYDYSKAVYVNTKIKVEIVCREHGSFWQLVGNHYKGCGCEKCAQLIRAKRKRSTTEQFIKKSRKIHGDKYNYSETRYIKNSIKVKIICPEHGEFYQIPSNHIKNKGCPSCAMCIRRKKNALGRDQFIRRSKITHNDKYDYSLVEYVNNRTKVKIICPKHGVFLQKPEGHLSGQGCMSCAIEGRSGKNHHNYKDGKSDQRDLERKTKEYYSWRKQVIESKMFCNCCGTKFLKGMEIHAHHLYSWINNPDKRYDVNNGVCICQDCHEGFHYEYGNGNNTPIQYEIYMESVRGLNRSS